LSCSPADREDLGWVRGVVRSYYERRRSAALDIELDSGELPIGHAHGDPILVRDHDSPVGNRDPVDRPRLDVELLVRLEKVQQARHGPSIRS
jgi:hypothetical protein